MTCGVEVDFYFAPAMPERGLIGFWKSALDEGMCVGCHETKQRLDSEAIEKEAKQRRWIDKIGQRAYYDFTMDKFVGKIEVPSDFPSEKSIYIHGPTGTGKTHLAIAILRTKAACPQEVSCVSPMNIFRGLRACEDALSEVEFLRSIIRRNLLLIDDLGVSKETEFSTQTMYEVINGRYMNARGGLIITSNLTLNELSKRLGDDRIASRLSQMCRIFELKGHDHRISR